MHRFKWITVGLLLLLAIIFALQNAEPVEIDLLFWSLIVSKSLLIVVLLLTGALLGWLFSFRGDKNRKPDKDTARQQGF